MSPTDLQTSRNIYRVLAVTFAGICVIFVVYTVRLLAVTRGLHAIRTGGQGAYVGAVVFPLLALSAGWLSVRWFGRARRIRQAEASTRELRR
jgi:hypothetical protein